MRRVPTSLYNFSRGARDLGFSCGGLGGVPGVFSTDSMRIVNSMSFSGGRVSNISSTNNCGNVGTSAMSLTGGGFDGFPSRLVTTNSPVVALSLDNGRVADVPGNSVGNGCTCLLRIVSFHFGGLATLSGSFLDSGVPCVAGVSLDCGYFDRMPARPLGDTGLHTFNVGRRHSTRNGHPLHA